LIKKKFIYDLLRFTDFSCYKWSVPKQIINGSNGVKAAFIRGVYEGDGTKLQWRRRIPYLEFHMYNIRGLKQIKELLLSLGIESKLYPYPKLIIKGHKDVVKFSKIINPKFKRVDLKSIIKQG
jgi:intein/homing endonuclease